MLLNWSTRFLLFFSSEYFSYQLFLARQSLWLNFQFVRAEYQLKLQLCGMKRGTIILTNSGIMRGTIVLTKWYETRDNSIYK